MWLRAGRIRPAVHDLVSDNLFILDSDKVADSTTHHFRILILLTRLLLVVLSERFH